MLRAGAWSGTKSCRLGIMTVEGKGIAALKASISDEGTRTSTVPILRFDHKSRFLSYKVQCHR